MNNRVAVLILSALSVAGCGGIEPKSLEKSDSSPSHSWDCSGQYKNAQGRAAHFEITFDRNENNKVEATISGENVHHDFVTTDVATPKGGYEGGATKSGLIHYIVKNVSAGAINVDLKSLNFAGVNLGDIQSIDLWLDTGSGIYESDMGTSQTFSGKVLVTKIDGKTRTADRMTCHNEDYSNLPND
ncbi:MAG: hypothetical protein NTV34_13755 [Proteobacteria bacterium]|nr:hypothetical protein [Pseudomonadota bacterium]